MRREINHLNSDTNQRAEHHKKKSGAGFVTFESQYQVRAARTQFSSQIFLQKENKLQVFEDTVLLFCCANVLTRERVHFVLVVEVLLISEVGSILFCAK